MSEFIYVDDTVFERLKKYSRIWGYAEDYSKTIEFLMDESDLTWV